ncbi:MAG TPA: thymidine phosphorylase family protein [Solimonas sp.]|nr:thymidine phosphorylase family protein [Solimonas sp.]
MSLASSPAPLQLRRLGIDTYQEPVVFLHADCPVCHSEGFEALARVCVSAGARSLIATLNVVTTSLVRMDEVGLSEAAWQILGSHHDEPVTVTHPEPLHSFSAVRAKIYGQAFAPEDLRAVMADISAGRYSGLELAAFVTACASRPMSDDETLALTRAMADAGARLAWPERPVVDKHCVGGLPGNRTTPIVVAIAAACGLTIPKTSSRAITSPAGTADTMETLAPVDLTLKHMRRVVEHEGGCLVWGGAMALSPADDVLIRVERPLDFDSDSQLVASIVSKKLAAGASHLLVDVPVGPTAKIRTPAAAQHLGAQLRRIAGALGIEARIVLTDGTQPVGRGVGPALEARDVLAVLRNAPDAPADLRERALLLSGHLLELGGKAALGQGAERARSTLDQGLALRKFEAICRAQGGQREPPQSRLQRVIVAARRGQVQAIDNRRLAKVAKLAGAPKSPAAGLELQVRCGQPVEAGQPLFTLHADSPGELSYAGTYADANPAIQLSGGSA